MPMDSIASHLKSLEFELEAIALWDYDFHHNPRRDELDVSAFMATQMRRVEIALELGSLSKRKTSNELTAFLSQSKPRPASMR